jgi:hypothetical protein
MELAWDIAVIVCAVLFGCFVFVIAFGAPFLPILKPQVPRALDLIDLKPGQTLLELGSGDGRILIEAAKRGINSVGYELNPLLVIYSWLVTRKYKGSIKIVWGNYWRKKLPPADGIFVFLLQPYMEKLDTKITQEFSKPVKLLSFAFHIPNKKPDKQKNGLFLYTYN